MIVRHCEPQAIAKHPERKQSHARSWMPILEEIASSRRTLLAMTSIIRRALVDPVSDRFDLRRREFGSALRHLLCDDKLDQLTVRGFREILDGKCDDLPEQAFMMAGTIDDVREKAEKIAKGA